MRQVITVILMISVMMLPHRVLGGGPRHQVTPATCPDHISVTLHRLVDGRIRIGLVLRPDEDFVPDFVYVSIGNPEAAAFTTQVALTRPPLHWTELEERANELQAIVWANDLMYQEGRFDIVYRREGMKKEIRSWDIRFTDFHSELRVLERAPE